MVNPSKTGDLGEKLNGQIDAAPFIWQAEWIGARAKSLVNATGFAGQVIAVFSDIAYLAGGDDEILWLVREGAPRHRRGIPVSFPPRSLLAGQGFCGGPQFRRPTDAELNREVPGREQGQHHAG